MTGQLVVEKKSGRCYTSRDNVAPAGTAHSSQEPNGLKHTHTPAG
jgi:hypothetical protein